MSHKNPNPTEPKVIRASIDIPLGKAAVLAMFEYTSHLRLASAMCMPPWHFNFDYFGVQLPLSPASTADGIVAEVRAVCTELAKAYAGTPAPSHATDCVFSAECGQHISNAAAQAVVNGQAHGNKYRAQGADTLAATRYKFSFNGVTVAFNPWAENEADRIVTAVRIEQDAAHKAYLESDGYKARLAADEAERRTLQAKVPVLMEHLPAALKRPLHELMEWVVDFATCHDRSGVETDPEAVVAAFNAEGYAAGAYVGEQYKAQLEAEDEAFGRYIIGQFLNLLPKRIGMPNAMWYFADQFRARTSAVTV